MEGETKRHRQRDRERCRHRKTEKKIDRDTGRQKRRVTVTERVDTESQWFDRHAISRRRDRERGETQRESDVQSAVHSTSDRRG